MKNEAKTIPYKNPKVGEAIYTIPPPVANIGSPNNPSDTYKSAEESLAYQMRRPKNILQMFEAS